MAVCLQDLYLSPMGLFQRGCFFEKSHWIVSFSRNANWSTFRYVAPERLNNEGFVEMINATKVRLIAIDEAHCISEWGHAFRPDYLKGKLPITIVIAWTLTKRCSKLRGLQKRFGPKEFCAWPQQYVSPSFVLPLLVVDRWLYKGYP